jgi:hypothetical protein
VRIAAYLQLILPVAFEENISFVDQGDLHLVLAGLQDLGVLGKRDLTFVFRLIFEVFQLPVLVELEVADLFVKPSILLQ